MGAGREEQWGGREAGRMGVVAELVEVHKLHSPHHSPARPRYREGDRFDAVNWIEQALPCLNFANHSPNLRLGGRRRREPGAPQLRGGLAGQKLRHNCKTRGHILKAEAINKAGDRPVRMRWADRLIFEKLVRVHLLFLQLPSIPWVTHVHTRVSCLDMSSSSTSCWQYCAKKGPLSYF